jgi:hypothetical protein
METRRAHVVLSTPPCNTATEHTVCGAVPHARLPANSAWFRWPVDSLSNGVHARARVRHAPIRVA